MSILNNYFLPQSSSDPAFHLWSSNGLLKISDLYDEGVFVSFQSSP